MNRIKLLCKCGRRLDAPLSAAGRKGRCPVCGAIMTIPSGFMGADRSSASLFDDALEEALEAIDTLEEAHPTASAPAKTDAGGAPAPVFQEIETASPDEAAALLFDKALPATPMQDEEAIRHSYQDISRAWGSRGLVEGPAPVVRRIVLHNLRRIAAEPGFDAIAVSVDKELKCAQADAFFPSAFTSVRVWRASSKVLACGNAQFTTDAGSID